MDLIAEDRNPTGPIKRKVLTSHFQIKTRRRANGDMAKCKNVRVALFLQQMKVPQRKNYSRCLLDVYPLALQLHHLLEQPRIDGCSALRTQRPVSFSLSVRVKWEGLKKIIKKNKKTLPVSAAAFGHNSSAGTLGHSLRLQ